MDMTKDGLENEPQGELAKAYEELLLNQRRQRRRREPKKISDVMSNLMARRGYARLSAESVQQQAWSQAAGKLAKHSRAGNIRRGVLEITVRNSAAMQELRFQRIQILNKLRQLVPESEVHELRFRVGEFS